jgi:hypothetical protein
LLESVRAVHAIVLHDCFSFRLTAMTVVITMRPSVGNADESCGRKH